MRPIRLLVLPVVALCALGATGAACTTPVKGPSSTGVRHELPIIASPTKARAVTATPAPASDVDLHSASAVALAEVEATWTLNTVVEAGWYEGELAATAYLTPRYAASIRRDPPVGPPGGTWIAWAAHRATTSVSARVEADPGGPRDTAVAAYRKVIATVIPHGTSVPGDPNNTATSIDAVTPDALGTTDQRATPGGAGEWVGRPEIWVSYLVLSRGERDGTWRVTGSETAL